MTPWLKAGLIGGAVLVVLDLLGMIPCVGIITCALGLVVYAGIGALTAYWMPPTRIAGQAAGQGALAASLAALIGGVVNAILMTIQTAVMGSEQILSQIPAEMLQQLEQSGVDPAMLEQLGPMSGLLGGSMCCVGGVILAAILGAIGGAVLAAIRPD